jgi:phage baseplate assembly protein gpV
MLIENLIGFIGTVINIDGVNENFGKVQIKITGDQGLDPNQDDLLWAFIMVPSTSPAEKGVGVTPNWLNVNTTVFGVFLDGAYKNLPIILGSLNQDKPSGQGISRLASGDKIQRTLTAEERRIGIDQKRNPSYNNNKVITTSAKETPDVVNHIIELDDTPSSERILVKHKSGTYVEIVDNGDVIIKSTKNSYEVVLSDKQIDVYGSATINCKQNATIKANSIKLDGEVMVTGSVLTAGPVISRNGATGVIVDVTGRTISIKGGFVESILGG